MLVPTDFARLFGGRHSPALNATAPSKRIGEESISRRVFVRVRGKLTKAADRLHQKPMSAQSVPPQQFAGFAEPQHPTGHGHANTPLARRERDRAKRKIQEWQMHDRRLQRCR